jgi:hypothetical protein
MEPLKTVGVVGGAQEKRQATKLNVHGAANSTCDAIRNVVKDGRDRAFGGGIRPATGTWMS